MTRQTNTFHVKGLSPEAIYRVNVKLTVNTRLNPNHSPSGTILTRWTCDYLPCPFLKVNVVFK